MSVLAHVVLGGALQNEPAATQALAYILKSKPDIAKAFVEMLRDADIEFEPGRIEAELEHGDSQPDLTIHDNEGRARLFVENKFWAGLTDAQPVSYLDHLLEDPPSALVFIVPEQRISTVWHELRARCSDAGLEWKDAAGNRARVGGKTMLVASWKYVLETLLDAARSKGHDEVRADLLQLQALTNWTDSEAFLPLREDEVTDQEIVRRLMNYIGLINGIVNKLVDDGIADTKGFMPAATFDYIRRYFRTHDKFELSLAIVFKIWRDHGISPLWLVPQRGTVDAFEMIRGSFMDMRIPNEGPCIPIRLKAGVEQERVIEDAAAQIKRIADALQNTIPDS
ncbi:MAG: hypothetical protein OXE57_18985 [Alphaproteobacteria bacterium]|nr:hypothetical protein [Alphaproteobacteria bacterium]